MQVIEPKVITFSSDFGPTGNLTMSVSNTKPETGTNVEEWEVASLPLIYKGIIAPLLNKLGDPKTIWIYE